jgi:hypothetical protein
MAPRRLAKVIRELRGEMTQEQLAKLASRGGPPKGDAQLYRSARDWAEEESQHRHHAKDRASP